MAEFRRVLQRCDPVLVEPCGESGPDCAEAAARVLFLTESRRVQKVLWRQLFVLDSITSLVEGLESARQLLTRPCPPQPDGGARSRWKALKTENISGTEETENLLRSLQDRLQQVHSRRHRLSQLLQQLQTKRRQQEQLAESLLKVQNALRSCDRQLKQLRAESEAALSQRRAWQRRRDTLQEHIVALQTVVLVRLISLDQSELSVEIRPRCSSGPSSNQLEPLRLRVTWCPDDKFTLQVAKETLSLMEDCSSGRWSQLNAALLDVIQSYVGQAELLCEIQFLRSSFAIDWCPAQRRLVYLKSASLVCHLEVEEGYPRGGRALLRSVQRDGRPVDTSGLKPHQAELSLTNWLVFLCNSPLI